MLCSFFIFFTTFTLRVNVGVHTSEQPSDISVAPFSPPVRSFIVTRYRVRGVRIPAPTVEFDNITDFRHSNTAMHVAGSLPRLHLPAAEETPHPTRNSIIWAHQS